jgi:DUF2075 family protein
LRTHLAEDVQTWCSLLLQGELDKAKELSTRMLAQGFDLYLTRDLNVAKNYARERYEGDQSKRYGLMASSMDRMLPRYGVANDYYSTQRVALGPWYNDLPESEKSCCQMTSVVTEFQCQGLELDLPIVCWGDDLLWTVSKWTPKPQPRSQAHDPDRLRINSYRVLLSRGRDGLVVFVAEEAKLSGTAEALRRAGLMELM